MEDIYSRFVWFLILAYLFWCLYRFLFFLTTVSRFLFWFPFCPVWCLTQNFRPFLRLSRKVWHENMSCKDWEIVSSIQSGAGSLTGGGSLTMHNCAMNRFEIARRSRILESSLKYGPIMGLVQLSKQGTRMHVNTRLYADFRMCWHRFNSLRETKKQLTVGFFQQHVAS